MAKRYNESPALVGLDNSGPLLELLASPDGSTWTIILSNPKGRSCIVAAGRDLQFLDSPKVSAPTPDGEHGT